MNSRPTKRKPTPDSLGSCSGRLVELSTSDIIVMVSDQLIQNAKGMFQIRIGFSGKSSPSLVLLRFQRCTRLERERSHECPWQFAFGRRRQQPPRGWILGQRTPSRPERKSTRLHSCH